MTGHQEEKSIMAAGAAGPNDISQQSLQNAKLQEQEITLVANQRNACLTRISSLTNHPTSITRTLNGTICRWVSAIEM